MTVQFSPTSVEILLTDTPQCLHNVGQCYAGIILWHLCDIQSKRHRLASGSLPDTQEMAWHPGWWRWWVPHQKFIILNATNYLDPFYQWCYFTNDSNYCIWILWGLHPDFSLPQMQATLISFLLPKSKQKVDSLLPLHGFPKPGSAELPLHVMCEWRCSF